MKLREHPMMTSTWPPIWSEKYGDIKVTGEIGTLTHLGNNAHESSRLFLHITYERVAYCGLVLIEDSAFRRTVYELLRKHIGHTIKDISDVDLSCPLILRREISVQDRRVKALIAENRKLGGQGRLLVEEYQDIAAKLRQFACDRSGKIIKVALPSNTLIPTTKNSAATEHSSTSIDLNSTRIGVPICITTIANDTRIVDPEDLSEEESIKKPAR